MSNPHCTLVQVAPVWRSSRAWSGLSAWHCSAGPAWLARHRGGCAPNRENENAAAFTACKYQRWYCASRGTVIKCWYSRLVQHQDAKWMPTSTTHELVLYCIGCMYQQLRWYGNKDLRLICRLYNMKHGGAGNNPAPPTVDHNGTTQRGTTQRNASTRDSRLKNQGLESLNAARQLSS